MGAGSQGVCLGRPDLVGKIWINKGYRVSLRRPLRWRCTLELRWMALLRRVLATGGYIGILSKK